MLPARFVTPASRRLAKPLSVRISSVTDRGEQQLFCDYGWGLYPWFVEHGEHLVHPDDRHKFDRDHPHGHVFVRLGEEGPYLVLWYVGGAVRVLPDLFQSVPSPRFACGQHVRTNPPRTPRVGTVLAVIWHWKREAPMFYIHEDGRDAFVHRGRYFAEELSPTGVAE